MRTIPQSADDCRFVHPSGAAVQTYLDNLAVLWPADPTLARRVEALDAATPADRLSAPPLPAEDLGQFLQGVDASEHFAFHVYGFGPHLLELFAHTGGRDAEAVFAVFEPDLRHLRDALLRDDYAAPFASRRVLLFTDADPADYAERMRPLSSLILLGAIGVGHAAGVARDPSFFAECRRVAAEFGQAIATDAATTLAHARKTSFNVAANLREYATTPGLGRLRNAYAGRPAILVAAGPSLRKNIETIKSAEGRAVVIAVQTALRPLLEAGVEPHFVTALDHHEISTRFYENLPADLATELVAEPKASGAVLRAWRGVPGRRLTLLGNDFAESTLREFHLGRPKLQAGTTVAHLSFSLAEWLGCSTAILVGQDLGFGDGLAYTPGTGYDDVWRPETGRFCTFEMKQWEHIARDRAALLRVEDWRGESTYTERRLFSYLQHFERMFAASPMEIVDATEGGVAKRYTRRVTLAEAVEELCRDPVPPVPDYVVEVGADVDGRLGRSLARRRAEAEIVRDVSRRTLPVLGAIRDAAGEPERANAQIARVDALRRELEAVEPTYALIMTLTQRSEHERFRADRRIRAAGLGGVERQRRQVERDLVNVRAVLAAAEDFLKLLDAALPASSGRRAA